MTTMGTITILLAQARGGDPKASNELFDRAYDELKSIASRVLAGKARCKAGLERTSLVNEAYARLSRSDKVFAENRRHFFFLFSRAMQDVLIEQARANLAIKRGRLVQRVPLDELQVDERQPVNILDVREALDELQQIDAQCAEIVMLKFFGRCTISEIAELLDCSVANVRRDWEYARAWLHHRLTEFGTTRQAR